MGLMRLPFILSRRTVGGAPGTQVAVCVEDVAGTGDVARVNVYYIYLHTDAEARHRVRVVPHKSGTPVWADVPLCSYARVPMQKLGGKWVLDGSILVAPILGGPNPLPPPIMTRARDAFCGARSVGLNAQWGCEGAPVCAIVASPG